MKISYKADFLSVKIKNKLRNNLIVRRILIKRITFFYFCIIGSNPIWEEKLTKIAQWFRVFDWKSNGRWFKSIF